MQATDTNKVSFRSSLLNKTSRSSGPSLTALSNAELLELCREGNRDAVDTLLKRFEGMIYAQAYRLTGNYDDANDIVAETYVRVCPMLGSCRNAMALPAWISRVVSNAFYDTCRRSQRTPAVSLDSLTEACGDACLPVDEDDAMSPERYVEARERKTIVNKALSSLPVHHRTMLKMFYLDDYTHEEISSTLGIALGTVKSRLNRARQALQQKMYIHQTALVG